MKNEGSRNCDPLLLFWDNWDKGQRIFAHTTSKMVNFLTFYDFTTYCLSV